MQYLCYVVNYSGYIQGTGFFCCITVGQSYRLSGAVIEKGF